MFVRRSIAAVSLVVVAAGCGAADGSDPTGGASSPPEATPGSAAAEPAGVPPFPEGTGPQSAENSGEWDLVLDGVRVGKREGFDRIVLEFVGTGTPGWQVNYAKAAVLDGSGEVIALAGDATLDIYASGTTYDPDHPYDGLGHVPLGEVGVVDDVYAVGTFEGYTQVLVGTDERVPFRVFALSDPARLVIDVAARHR